MLPARRNSAVPPNQLTTVRVICSYLGFGGIFFKYFLSSEIVYRVKNKHRTCMLLDILTLSCAKES